MSRLAVIGTFYQRFENTPLIAASIRGQTRQPDELWLMCEGSGDRYVCEAQQWGTAKINVVTLSTPMADGRYAIIPYSNKINHALDRTGADYIVYLDNGSLPHHDKYRLMADALDEHPEWGAVYCGQHRSGYSETTDTADSPVPDAFCRLNYTQVMHRRTADRWTLDMAHADPDLADAIFWRDLHASLGTFWPAAPGRILDEHHIPSSKASGL